MEKKIAVPVNEAGVLDSHFGHCKFFAMVTVLDGEIVNEERIVPPPHEPGVLPKFLAEKGVTDIIAGGMGQKAIQLFQSNGVNAFVGAPQVALKELVDGFLKGSLSFTANYCDH
ncbi:NifB/NifX family molybdenum-iron cluster-binding protein [Plebeiibacterium marinum]|uniref:ATPase n=1 Tax=Plebeiibacterium marinum TaxID=2992111 RepID=A0AAE3MH36_9BACT|nr:NifB/NifX family molybdenum-iron cluster-binding protein [Plebeiobacterium marinum]MCW3807596.1 ATPase [Plebeiobacterium marinum]